LRLSATGQWEKLNLAMWTAVVKPLGGAGITQHKA
jgi:hypothetical protein